MIAGGQNRVKYSRDSVYSGRKIKRAIEGEAGLESL